MIKDSQVVVVAFAVSLVFFSLILSFHAWKGDTGSPVIPLPATTGAVTTGTTSVPAPAPMASASPEGRPVIRVAVPEHLYRSGLLQSLSPGFEDSGGRDIWFVPLADSDSFDRARDLGADVVISDSTGQETSFLEAGDGLNRRTFAAQVRPWDGTSSEYTGICAMAIYTPEKTAGSIRDANLFIGYLISPMVQEKIGTFGSNATAAPLYLPANRTIRAGTDITGGDDGKVPTAIRPLKVYYPSSLDTSFAALKKKYEKAHPDTDVLLFPGSNAENTGKIAVQHHYADVMAVTGDSIAGDLYPDDATFEITYARNPMVIAYTNRSRGAGTITAGTWHTVLLQDNVTFATGNPGTEATGYRAYMAIALAGRYYGNLKLFDALVTSHSNITTTVSGGRTTISATDPAPDNKKLFIAGISGPSALGLLRNGTADYLFTYRNIAERNGLSYVTLPPGIDMSDSDMAERYATVRVRHLSGSGTTTTTGRPNLYRITVPASARNPAEGAAFISLLIGSGGRTVIASEELVPVVPARATGYGVPDILLPDVRIA